jgi:hypothetical protein
LYTKNTNEQGGIIMYDQTDYEEIASDINRGCTQGENWSLDIDSDNEDYIEDSGSFLSAIYFAVSGGTESGDGWQLHVY